MSVSRIKLGAVLVGWVVSLFTLFIMIITSIAIALYLKVDLTSSLIKGNHFNSFSFNFTVFISMFAAYFAGGYVAGRMAALAGAVNGAMVVATNVAVIVFAVIFATIVGNNLGIDVMGPVVETIISALPILILIGIFALLGGVLGGKLGEGYFTRLDIALARLTQDKKANQEISQNGKNKARQENKKQKPASVQSKTNSHKKKEPKKTKQAS